MCKTWFYTKLQLVLFPFLIGLFIIIVNELLKLIFEILSKFEAHPIYSDELASRTIKVYIV